MDEKRQVFRLLLSAETDTHCLCLDANQKETSSRMEGPGLKPRPPPRSSSIKNNICKLFATKSNRSSYALNPKKKSLTRSRFSCSALSAVAGTDCDLSLNRSLTRLPEEGEPLKALQSLSISRSNEEVTADFVSRQNGRQDCPDRGPHVSQHPAAKGSGATQSYTSLRSNNTVTKDNNVVLRNKTCSQNARPKSECFFGDTGVRLREHKPKRGAERFSTFEVSLRGHNQSIDEVDVCLNLVSGK